MMQASRSRAESRRPTMMEIGLSRAESRYRIIEDEDDFDGRHKFDWEKFTALEHNYYSVTVNGVSWDGMDRNAHNFHPVYCQINVYTSQIRRCFIEMVEIWAPENAENKIPFHKAHELISAFGAFESCHRFALKHRVSEMLDLSYGISLFPYEDDSHSQGAPEDFISLITHSHKRAIECIGSRVQRIEVVTAKLLKFCESLRRTQPTNDNHMISTKDLHTYAITALAPLVEEAVDYDNCETILVTLH